MGFVREAWPVLHPNTAYVHGWHIDAICKHLEAVTAGRINRLLINVPPGSMKSLLCSVFWPAWEWTINPSLQYLSTSYSMDYVTRDIRKTLNLVTSDWYQQIWGDKIALTREGATSFANTKFGNREGRPFIGLTGGRGDRLIIDDPHSTVTADFPVQREATIRVFRESVPSRINDPVRSAIVIIMQRLHEGDVSGVALDLKLGYTHLKLPMEFEADSRCITYIDGEEFFRDPRTYDGELLLPERFTAETVARDKAAMTAYAVAGQYQQRPAPREGGIFKKHWFEIVGAVPARATRVRAWDLAATKGGGAFTAGVRMSVSNGTYYIEDVVRLRGSAAEVEAAIRNVARADGRATQISIPQDPGQAGKAQVAAFARALAGYNARFSPETGDKMQRALPVSAQAEIGNVKVVKGAWNDAFFEEITTFPAGNFKDQVDALSRAFSVLVRGAPRAAFGAYQVSR